MKKYLVVVAVMLLCIGCGNTDTPDTEENTQQTESSVTDQDEETSSATSETTETEITTEREIEVQTEVENETQTESEVPSEPEAPTYTYTDMDKTMYAKSSVNVRDLPSTDGNKLGGLSKAQEVHVTGQCNETNWYRIEYNGGTGYVSNNYLQETKPEQQEANNTPPTSSKTYTLMNGRVLEYGVIYVNKCGNNLYNIENPTASEGKCPYPLYTMIDNGDGTYTAYVVGNHGGMLDNQYFDFDGSKAEAFLNEVVMQGYIFQYAGGDSWHACVGGYDEGCVHKIIIYKLE